MADLEVNELLAVKLMEWELSQTTRNLHPFPVQTKCYFDKDGNFIMYPGYWSPCTDITQALGDGGPGTVVGRMRGLGFNFNLNWQQLPEIKICIVQFHKISGNLEHGQGADNLPARAISHAAAAAVMGREE